MAAGSEGSSSIAHTVWQQDQRVALHIAHTVREQDQRVTLLIAHTVRELRMNRV